MTPEGRSVDPGRLLSTREGWLLAAVLSGGAYALIGHGLPVGDDWNSVTDVSAFLARGDLLGSSFQPYNAHWSPLFLLGSGLSLWASPEDFGLSWVRAINALWLALSLFAFVGVARLYNMGRLATWAGAVLLVFHQCAVGTQYQWDSIGPMGADAFGRLATLTALSMWFDPARVGARRLLFLALTVLLALLFKETALATVSGAGTLLVCTWIVTRKQDPQVRFPWTLCATLCLAAVLFVILRQVAGGATDVPGGRYLIAPPSRWLINVALLGGALAMPVSSLSLWSAWHLSRWWVLALGAGAASVAVLWLAGGLRHAHRARFLDGRPLVVAALAAFFPMMLMGHVSEVYVSPSLFFVCLCVSASLEGWRRGPGGKRASWALAVAALLLAIHGQGWLAKNRTMAEGGQRALDDARSIVAAATRLPEEARIHIDERPRTTGVPPYSVFEGRVLVPATRMLLATGGSIHRVVGNRDQATHVAGFSADGVSLTRCGPRP